MARACKFAPAVNPNPNGAKINIVTIAPIIKEVLNEDDEEPKEPPKA